MKRFATFLMLLVAMAGPFAMVGCEKKSSTDSNIEKVGEKVEDAADKAGDAIEDMGDKVKEMADEAAE